MIDLESPIECLELPTRARKVLYRLRVATVREFLACDLATRPATCPPVGSALRRIC